MLFWLMVAIILAVLGVIEMFLNFTVPFTQLRTVLLFLLILGMLYRSYLMERSGEKENMKQRLRELEDKLRELEMGAKED
jgi:membrane protein implicated in regulation of membrane protease activity